MYRAMILGTRELSRSSQGDSSRARLPDIVHDTVRCFPVPYSAIPDLDAWLRVNAHVPSPDGPLTACNETYFPFAESFNEEGDSSRIIVLGGLDSVSVPGYVIAAAALYFNDGHRRSFRDVASGSDVLFSLYVFNSRGDLLTRFIGN